MRKFVIAVLIAAALSLAMSADAFAACEGCLIEFSGECLGCII